nr:TPA: hypothetical protein [Oryctes rhinoceros nudivirus]
MELEKWLITSETVHLRRSKTTLHCYARARIVVNHPPRISLYYFFAYIDSNLVHTHAHFIQTTSHSYARVFINNGVSKNKTQYSREARDKFGRQTENLRNVLFVLQQCDANLLRTRPNHQNIQVHQRTRNNRHNSQILDEACRGF